MSIPAGWYDDPGAPGQGRLRWWDGQAWTEHVRSAAQASAPVSAPAAGPVPGSGAGPGAGPGAAPGVGPVSAPSAAPAYGYQGAPGAVAFAGKPTHTPDGDPLANVWLRLAARLIDFLITGVVMLLVSLPFLPRIWGAYMDYFNQLDQAAVTGATPDPFGLYTDPDFYQPYLLLLLIGLVFGGAYFVVCHRVWGATPGKMMLGLKVRPWDRPGPPGWGASFLRWGLEALGGLLCSGIFNLLDALWCLWDDRRQTLHDKVARTVVVSRR